MRRSLARLAIARGSSHRTRFATAGAFCSQSHEGWGRTQPRNHADSSVMTTAAGKLWRIENSLGFSFRLQSAMSGMA